MNQFWLYKDIKNAPSINLKGLLKAKDHNVSQFLQFDLTLSGSIRLKVSLSLELKTDNETLTNYMFKNKPETQTPLDKNIRD